MEVDEFWAVDWEKSLFGIHNELGWNGTWSSSCYGYAYTLFDGVAWGEAYSTSGGTCWVGYPSFDSGNAYDIIESSASWNSNIYNAGTQCTSQGATGHWWTKIYGRGSGVVIDYTFTPGGNCGAWMSPYIT
jgi:hypothetical protein